MKKTLAEAKRKEQQRRWDEATKWRRATNVALGDVDLEKEMEKAEEAETTATVTESVKTAVTTTAGSTRTEVTMTAASSSTQVVAAEVYARPYTKTTESRGECSTARSKRKEAMEREAMVQRQKDEEDHIAKEKEAADQCRVVEKALLEEEEKVQAELLRKLREKTERKKLKDMREGEPKEQIKTDKNTSQDEPKRQGKAGTSKDELKKQGKEDENVAKDEPKKHDKQTKKSSEWEAKKRKYMAEEEERYVDDEELDPDFDPDKEFIEEDDMVIEEDDEEDTFEVHKHSHALNFAEAGEFVVWVWATFNELQRAVKRGKEMEKHYRQFVTVLKDAIIKMGSWGPIEGADVEAVVKTIVDLNCTAWKKAMQGVKTGNSKMIMKIEEK